MAEELEATYGAESQTPAAPCDRADGAPDAEDFDVAPDLATAAAVADGAARVMPQEKGDPQGVSGAGSSADAPPRVAQPPVPVDEPWLALGDVTAMGYVYDQTRMVMRVQRGKPKNSVTINCYRHSGCRMLLTERRCPDDAALKRWLFEVPRAPPGSSREEERRLASEHMAIGKGRWAGRRS